MAPVLVSALFAAAGGRDEARPAETPDPRLVRIDAFRVPEAGGDFRVRTKISDWNGTTLVETALFDVYASGADKSLVIARDYKTEGMRLL
ncbi:MAG: hypothetical protein JW742_06130, partial [Candidatus Aminicenantes bacterium]|nr:hypothetical protein [Candidatus Aminicenantes bacterium]